MRTEQLHPLYRQEEFVIWNAGKKPPTGPAIKVTQACRYIQQYYQKAAVRKREGAESWDNCSPLITINNTLY